MEFRTLIDVAALRKLQGSPGLAVVDCRFDLLNAGAGRQAYRAAHIPGAVYADLNEDLAGPVSSGTGRHPLPDPTVFAGRLGELGIDRGTQVVAYDEANGSFAARLWWMLRWMGHEAAAVLDGGFKAWTCAGGAVQSGEIRAEPRLFTPPAGSPTHSPAVMTTDEVARALQNPDSLLVDARAPGRFAGTAEPIDAVAGHIPGAVNHPFSSSLDADGRFLPVAELNRRWRARLAGKEPRNLIAMCGSGVTACHNLLSLEAAGLGGAKLYAGSWSEWIRDPKRPIARG
jgi:thiosulfate/3-mercaptopyruvate sulfurtransferase